MNAATRAVIERLVEALVTINGRLSRMYGDGLSDRQMAAIAEARKLLEGDALAQPADEDAWQREMFSLINELHSAGLDGSRGRCRNAVLALNENVRTRPQQAGFVSVPVDSVVFARDDALIAAQQLQATLDRVRPHLDVLGIVFTENLIAWLAAATKGDGK